MLLMNKHIPMNSINPSIAVVILNWNGIALLKSILPKVIEYSTESNVSIFVADNASTDESVRFINSNFPTIKIIELDKNYGFAAGYNKALKQINTTHYLLLNSDAEPTENWLNPFFAAIINYPKLGAAQPKIKDYYQRDKFEYAGAAGGFIDKYGYPFCRGRIFNNIEADFGQYNQSTEIFWASGAAILVKAEIFHNLGGLDESFFAHMEEIDLCWRINLAGFQIRYLPESTVYHMGGATLNQLNPRKTFLNFRNNLLMVKKNLPKNKRVKILSIRLFLDAIAAIRLLASGKFQSFIAIIKAHWSFFFLSFKSSKQEKPITTNKIENIYNKSIVLDYFILRKSKFNQLEFHPTNNL